MDSLTTLLVFLAGVGVTVFAYKIVIPHAKRKFGKGSFGSGGSGKNKRLP